MGTSQSLSTGLKETLKPVAELWTIENNCIWVLPVCSRALSPSTLALSHHALKTQLQRVPAKTHLIQKLSETPTLAILQNLKNTFIKQIHNQTIQRIDLKPFLAIFGTGMRAKTI
jgi:hypothetical protein